MKSRYELAINLFMILKKSVLKVHLLYKQVEKELPNTEYSKTALILEKTGKEKKDFAVVKKKQKQELQL
jgi:outer membrane protein assembly factor BamD